MKLTILERLVLLQILPKEGDFTTLKIVRKLRESLSFSEEEHKELDFKQDEGQVRWNQSASLEKDIHIGEKVKDVVIEVLKKLDEDKKLTDDTFGLYGRFVNKD